MQDPSFESPFIATHEGKDYPCVILIDFVQGIVTFQDKPYHPSEIHTRPLDQITISMAPQIIPNEKGIAIINSAKVI